MAHGMRDSIDLDLPDLPPDQTIRADNIRAMQAIYVAAQLEELKITQVADVLVQQFQNGLLPLDRTGAGQMSDYLRDRPNRLTEPERRGLYARAFGVPGGDTADVRANRAFNDLWVRLLESVDAFARLATPTLPGDASPGWPDLVKAARDLAGNLSLHGYGIGYFAAAELQKETRGVLRLVSMPAILQAFGVSDLWQLVDRVSAASLGGARNAVRHRTLAASGSAIIGWLANRVPMLTSETAEGLLDVSADRDVVDACRIWLAVVPET